MYRILIVDDEPDIVEMLRCFFERRGYFVLTATDGAEALKKAEQQPDMILLDVNMPELDGMEVCRRIRDFVPCPILFLTARIEESDRVQGFAAGGDDYILKPFSLAELEARVAAHLRRETRRINGASVRFDKELSIDYSQRKVFVNKETLAFPKKEFAIIELLSANAGQVFDKERIYEKVWGYDGEGDSSVVAEHIRRIRARLSAVTDREYIETVWGCGYKWKS
nr:response regulator transcription factor [Marvinbryantia formatexigens]